MTISNTAKYTVRDICIIALLTIVLFVQEELLTFLPNIQLTIFLMILYSKVLGFKKTFLIIVIYLLLDCIVMGALNPIFMIFQLLGWEVIPALMCTIFKKIDSNIILAVLAMLFSFIYSWTMILPGCIITNLSFNEYLVADILFEFLLALSSFLSTLVLYKPFKKLLLFETKKYYQK